MENKVRPCETGPYLARDGRVRDGRVRLGTLRNVLNGCRKEESDRKLFQTVVHFFKEDVRLCVSLMTDNV